MVTPPPAALVRPGSTHTYEWTVPVGGGPLQGEADCLTYLYYSGVDPVKDTNSGLVGPLLVCRPGSLKKGVQVRKRSNAEIYNLVLDFSFVSKRAQPINWVLLSESGDISRS